MISRAILLSRAIDKDDLVNGETYIDIDAVIEFIDSVEIRVKEARDMLEVFPPKILGAHLALERLTEDLY